ncbi:MAG: hypothetical protein AB9833_03940 [Bacteroidales bacterium]
MHPSTKIEPWEIDNVRFVGFMDIMGFKDLVARKSHDDVKHMLNKMVRLNKSLENVFGKPRVIVEDRKKLESRIRSVTFSDSIMFISQDDSLEDFIQISIALSIFQEASLQRGAPTKGAMSLGMLTADFDNSIFFGQPLIDAYLLQDQLKYYGIVADNKIEEYLIEKKRKQKPSEPKVDSAFIKLKTPFKSGKIMHYNLHLDSNSPEQLEDLYKNVSGDPRIYVDNTIEMFKLMNP